MAVSVIAILMAIIIPAIGGAQNSAKRAKTRVQFSQWSAAIEQFRQEYGYYPAFGASGTGAFDDGFIDGPAQSQRFVETLSGRRMNGSPLEAGDPGLLAGNTKRIAFCQFGSGDLTGGATPVLQDAFGNTLIYVLLDRNLSGMITFAGNASDDYPTAPGSVATPDGSPVASPIEPSTIVRAGVAFYSAGDGQTPVTSW